MIEKFLPDLVIINHLYSDYGIAVKALIPLSLGADMDASVYKAQSDDQKSYFLKVKQGHNDIGPIIIELLRNAGIQPIISPLKTIPGQLTKRIDNLTLTVYPFIEGLDGFSQNLTETQWLTLGRTLRQIHEVSVPLLIQNQIRLEDFSSKWRDAVRVLYVHIAAEQIGDEITLKLLKFMKDNILAIHRLVDRAEALAQQLQKQSHKFVLCHSDIHGGNVLMDGSDTIYIVDWDDPVMAPKERDLMFIGGGVANVWNKPHEEKLFYEGYGNTEINLTALAYYRHERIVEDIAIYGQKLLMTTEGGADRLEMYKQFIAMFECDGVVDIAFKTDEA